MENASKALIIAGAILLSILIIAIGMYIYSSAQAQVNNSMTTMSATEIEGFNSNFTSYEGVQTGSQVKALIQRLIATANTYKEEQVKIPAVSYNTDDNGHEATEAPTGKNRGLNNLAVYVSIENETAKYVEFLNVMSKGIDLKHPYRVVMTMSTEGVVRGITINYDRNDRTENFTPVVPGDLYGIDAGNGITVNDSNSETVFSGDANP